MRLILTLVALDGLVVLKHRILLHSVDLLRLWAQLDTIWSIDLCVWVLVPSVRQLKVHNAFVNGLRLWLGWLLLHQRW